MEAVTSPPLISSSLTIFNDTSTAGHATITNQGGIGIDQASLGGATIFEDSSTADGAILIANGG